MLRLFLLADYELQVSLSEALCRLTPRSERQRRASQWFSSADISTAFCDITDKDFEVVTDRLNSQSSACWCSSRPLTCLSVCLSVSQDCRRFLNFFNGFHGDQRRCLLSVSVGQ